MALLAPEMDFLRRGGETGALIAERDWSGTSVGPIETWPESLKTALGMLLHSPVPIVLLWGEDGIMLYNDAYSGFAGGRHPRLLGSKVREGWPDVADFNDNVMRVGLAGGTLSYRDQELTLYRYGAPEQVWMNLDYSPVFGAHGRPEGVVAIVVETTQRVLAERRQIAQRDRLAELFEQAPAVISMLEGPEHVFTLCNAEHRRLLGGRDVLGLTVREAEPDLEGQGVFDLLDEVYRTGKPYAASARPMRFLRADGRWEERRLDLVYQPTRDRSGAVSGIFCLCHDVTDRVATQSRLSLALEAGRMAVWEHVSASNEIIGSPQLLDMLGLPPGARLDPEALRARYHPGHMERLTSAAMSALQQGGRFFQAEYRFHCWDGVDRWFLLRAEMILDEHGKPVRTIGVMIDISDRKHGEEALREREAELTAALDAGKLAIFDFDYMTGAFRPSPRLNELYGYPPDRRLTIADLRARYHPDDAAGIIEQAGRQAADPDLNKFDWAIRLLMPDGRSRWLEGRGEFIRDEEGRPLRSRGVLMDITDRRNWEEQQRLLVHELNHRVKNTLAIVQGLVQQSFRAEGLSPAARRTFEARLAALSAAHDLLTRGSWEPAPLAEVLMTSVSAAAGDGADRVVMGGPAILLSAQAAVSLALAAHELCTNALKYGALSKPEGRVAVSWGVSGEPGRLRLEWREIDGPPVTPPSRRGFGSRLISDALARQLGAAVDLRFPAAGVTCVIDAPLADLTGRGAG